MKVRREDLELMVVGEARIDPMTQNTYVRQEFAGEPKGWVTLTDIFGGHQCQERIQEWESWPLAPEPEVIP